MDNRILIQETKKQHPDWSFAKIARFLNLKIGSVRWYLRSEQDKANRRRNHKKSIIELKMSRGGKCQICQYNKCLAALHFHHLNPKTKEGQIANLFYSHSKETAEKEASKCQLICANCHAELHHCQN
jgi:hypothetical protein